MASCTLNLTINKSGGGSDVISIGDLDIGAIQSIEDIVELLSNKKYSLQLQDLKDYVNNSRFPITELTLEEIDGNLVGNYSLETAVNVLKYGNDDIELKGLLEACRKLKIFSEDFNIILTVRPGQFTGVHIGNNGRSVAILPTRRIALEKYMQYLIVSKRYNLGDPILLDIFEEFLEQLQEPMSKKKNLNTYPLLYEALQNQDILTIIGLYFNDSKTEWFLRKLEASSLLLTAIVDLTNKDELSINILDDTFVVDFLLELQKTDSRKIRLDKLESLVRNKSIFPSDEEFNPVKAIQYINNHIQGGRYIDIDFITEEEVILKKTKYLPSFESSSYNSTFFGTDIIPIKTFRGITIFTYNGHYYTSDIIPLIAENLGRLKYTLLKAEVLLHNKLNTSLDFKTIQLLSSIEDFKIYKGTAKLPSKFRFIRKNISLPQVTSDYFSGHNATIAGKRFPDILATLKSDPSWKFIAPYVDELNTQYLLSLYLIKKQEFEDNGESEEEASNKTLELIRNTPDELFEASLVIADDESTSYKIEKVETNVPLFKTLPRFLKLDIIGIALNLQQRFGVLVKPLTKTEIKRLFPEISEKSKAFIANGIIYVNMDTAHSNNLVHEFGHLILGTIRQKDPQLYFKFINFIDSLRELPAAYHLFGKYAQSKRTRADINEEVFSDLFGSIVSKGISAAVREANDISPEDIMRIQELYKDGVDKVFGTSGQSLAANISDLLNMTIDQLNEQYGSIIGGTLDNVQLDEEYTPDFINIKSKESRIVLRILENLRQNKLLNEDCNG